MAGSNIVRVEVRVDKTRKLIESLNALIGKDVLVGVPSTVAKREGEAVNSAMLAYIHEHGAPAANIPARPFLVPGIIAAKAEIGRALGRAVDAALSGETAKAEGFMNRAGIAAVNSVKNRIRGNIPPPLKPATIRGRMRGRGAKSRRKGEAQYAELLSQGASPGAAQSAAGIVALVNTGQMLRAITWVLRQAVGAKVVAPLPPAQAVVTARRLRGGPLTRDEMAEADRASRGAF